MHSIFDSPQGLFLIRTYWRSVSEFTHLLRQLIQDSGSRLSSWNSTTHNLLVKNEYKIPALKNRPFRKNHDWCVRCGEKFETKWRFFGEELEKLAKNRSRFSPSYRQRFSRHSPIKNCTQKSASPAGVPRGCDQRKNLVRRCITSPWNDLKLSEISFINPLRYASIANATTGLIQAMILHSSDLFVRGLK